MIQCDDLTKHFDTFKAVEGVSFDIQPGEVLALLGQNGAGKTTTVRMLTSVLAPTRGWARVAGYDTVKHPTEVRASVGVLTEMHGLYGRMTGYEYLDFFGQVYSLDKPRRDRRAKELLEYFGLGQAGYRRSGEYSKGMRQKLALARALIHEPPVLLLDEPTSAMDPESAQLVRHEIARLRSSQRAIIICTHNLVEAEMLADKIAIIYHGRILLSGTLAEMRERLLGPAEYDVQMAGSHAIADKLQFPAGVTLLNTWESGFRFRVENPQLANPLILQQLFQAQVPLVAVQEVPRTLEMLYLKAMQQAAEESMKRFDQAWLVAKRELVDQMRDWRILLPMIILTMFFPYLMNVAAKGAVDYINQYGASLIAERLLPFLILVVGYFPVTVSLVVALEAFVGEKERGTIEPLLTSPLADEHLYLGKLMAGTIVPLTVSFIGIALYMGGLWWQGIKWPEWGFITQTLALTVVQTLLMVSAAIVISTQSTTVRAANLLASFIVIPIALLIQGESALMFWGTNDVLWLAVIGVGILSALVIRLGIAHFKRENLLGREIDMLSLSWVWKTFSTALTGSSQPTGLFRYLRSAWRQRRGETAENISLGEALWQDWNGLIRWYREDVTQALRRLAPALGITLTIGFVTSLVAYFYVDYNLPQTMMTDERLQESIKTIRGFLLENNPGGLSSPMLFWHNLRAELVMLVLGIFSFGVLSVVAFMGNFALIGGVLGFMRVVGISPWVVFFAGIMPHGIVELPSVILLSAAVLHMGVRLVTPEASQSIGETMIITFADVIKLLVALCIPLLLIAALIEANITPHILLAAVGHSLDIQP